MRSPAPGSVMAACNLDADADSLAAELGRFRNARQMLELRHRESAASFIACK